MIQFNLLPDVKLEYIKTERTKRLVISIATLSGIVALAVFVILLFTVDVLQKKSLHDVNGDIKTDSAQIEKTPDLNKILTIQNQLASLTPLHDQKPAASRLFTYLSQVTPSAVTISNVNTDFTQNTMTITGAADSIDSVNTFVDTLKFTTFTTAANTTAANAFTNVVLSSFGRTSTAASYTITLSFAAPIFSNESNVKLTVPNTVTTRSVTEQPNALFKSDEGTK